MFNAMFSIASVFILAIGCYYAGYRHGRDS